MLMASETTDNSAAVFWGAWSICWWHQKQQIIPLRFFEALDPYADGIRGGVEIFRCGVLRRLIHMLMASEAVENSAAVFWSSIRTNRCSKSMCCWHQKPKTDNSAAAAVFWGAWSICWWHQRRVENSAAVFEGAWSICWWHQKQQENSAAVFWSSIRTNRCSKSMCCWHQKQQIIPLRFFEALDPYADGIRGNRKFRCGFLRRLIHMLMASEAVENSAAVFWGAWSICWWHQKQYR